MSISDLFTFIFERLQCNIVYMFATVENGYWTNILPSSRWQIVAAVEIVAFCK